VLELRVGGLGAAYVQTRLGRRARGFDPTRSFDGRRLGVVLAVLAAFGAGEGAASAGTQTCTWKGPSNGLFSTPANWSNCGSNYPGQASQDNVVFDATNGTNNSCSIDVAIDVNSITFQNGYSATVSPSGATAIRVRAGITMPSGKLTLTSATTQVGGSFNQSGGTLTANGGTVLFNAAGAVTHAFNQSLNKLIINDGLVAYWNLDEGSGTSRADSSGYGNNLTLSAASVTAAVPSLSFTDPSAVAFNGTLFAHLTATPPTSFPAGGAAQTISAWVKLGATTGTQDLVALGDGGSNGIKLGLLAGTLAAWTWGNSPSTLVTGTTPTDGKWHHLAYTYDGTTNRLYLDGVLAPTTNNSHQNATTTQAFLGTWDGTHELMANGGALDEVRIYTRALTATEVSGLALGGMPATALATHTFSNALTTDGDFVIASGAVSGTKNITINGSWLNYGGAFTNTGNVALSGTTGVVLSGGQLMAGTVTIGSGSTYTLSDRLWAPNQNLTVNGALDGGAFVVHAGTMKGSGTFTPGTGTVVLDNGQTLGTSAVATFNGLRLEDPTESSLVAYWKLDEGNSTAFRDLSGSGNTGTLSGGATWTAAASGIGFDDAAALSLDGSTGYASMGTNKIPKANATQTISVWAKFSSTAGVQDIATLVDPADANGLKIGINAGKLNVSEYGGAILISTTAPSVNVWHHVAYVYSSSGSGTDQLYIDGALFTGGGNTTTHQSGAPTIAYLGTYNGSAEFFKGQIDDVRVYSAALSSAQVAQLAAGRYAGTGGYGTVTLGQATTVNGALALDAGNLDAGGNTLTAALASSIATGTYTVGSAAQTFSGGLSVQLNGTVTLASSTGSLAIGSGKTLTMDGTLNASAAGAAIQSVSGFYTFKVGSTATATPTLNLSGLSVKNTDGNGLWIGANTSSTTTFTKFDNIAFSNGTGAQLLQIYAPTLYLPSNGCTFDGSTTYAVKLIGNGTGDGTETRAIFGDATCATNASSGLCATSEKSDDDANNDGLADSPGNGVNFGAVVQFARAAEYTGGTFQGFPTAAFDWNTFSYYATYAVFRNEAGSADIVYVRDEAGNALYSWTTGTGENIIGTPQWTTVGSTHYLFVATNNGSNAGKIYRLVDSGTSLALDAVWSALSGGDPYGCSCTIKSQLSLDANNVYWAATTSSSNKLLMEVGQSSQSVMTGWAGGLPTPANVTTSSPELAASGGTPKLYLGIAGDLLQLDVTGTTFVANTNPGTVSGRVSVGTSPAGTARVYAGDSSGKMWAISPTNFTSTNFLWSYSAGSAINGSSYYDTSTDTLQFGTAGGTIVVLTGAGSGTAGVALNSGYPYTLDASDPITAAPLYYGGVLVVGTTLGKLYFLDRNTGAGVGVISEYSFGPTESVSGVAFDPNTNRYMVSTSSTTAGVKDGRLYYFDLVGDPTPTSK
jgi:hypothetical protein